DRCFQLPNFAIERLLLWAIRRCLWLATFWIKSTGICSGSRKDGTYSSIRIDVHETGDTALVVNRPIIDAVDKTSVTYLAKTTVHTREWSDYGVVVSDGEIGPGFAPDCDVSAAGGAPQRASADALIVATRHVVAECGCTKSGVATTVHVVQ